MILPICLIDFCYALFPVGTIVRDSQCPRHQICHEQDSLFCKFQSWEFLYLSREWSLNDLSTTVIQMGDHYLQKWFSGLVYVFLKFCYLLFVYCATSEPKNSSWIAMICLNSNIRGCSSDIASSYIFRRSKVWITGQWVASSE